MLNETKIRNLLDCLPHPEGAAPEGVYDEVLATFSKSFGIILPTDVIELLRLTNAPCIGGQGLFGITDNEYRNIEFYTKLFPEWRARGWIPIGTDGSGNYYVVPNREDFGKGYPVLFIEAVIDSNVPAYIVASDVGHFVEFIIERELRVSQWPFDKDEVLTKDPDIVNYQGVTLPWEDL